MTFGTRARQSMGSFKLPKISPHLPILPRLNFIYQLQSFRRISARGNKAVREGAAPFKGATSKPAQNEI